IGVCFIPYIGATRCQRKFAVQVQITRTVDLDAPDNQFIEPGFFEFPDIYRDVLVNRSTSQNADIACLCSGRAGESAKPAQDQRPRHAARAPVLISPNQTCSPGRPSCIPTHVIYPFASRSFTNG